MHCFVTLHIYIVYIVELQTKTAYQNVRWFVFQLNIAVQNIYNANYIKMSSIYVFKVVKKQSGIGFIVDALFGYFAYLLGPPSNLFFSTSAYFVNGNNT